MDKDISQDGQALRDAERGDVASGQDEDLESVADDDDASVKHHRHHRQHRDDKDEQNRVPVNIDQERADMKSILPHGFRLN